MEQRCEDLLSEDCWELVFNRLGENYSDICSVSSVCKTFLSITNKLITGLKLKDLPTDQFTRLFQRFKKLKSVDIRRKPHEELVHLVSQLLHSSLELESLAVTFPETPSTSSFQGSGLRNKTLKWLTVTNPSCDDDLISLVDLFPCLEKLTIFGLNDSSCPVDSGIEVLASKLKGVMEITLVLCSGITDQSLNFISSNCSNLTKIFILKCPGLTEVGIGYIMRNCSKLTTLSVSCLDSSKSNGEQSFNLENSFPYAENLEDIRIYGMDVSDALLRSIANSCHRLKRVKFTPGQTFTFSGLEKLLRVCSSLEYFKPGAPWLTDKNIVDISSHFKSLTHINLEGSTKLSSATFYLLLKRCPHLQKIVMDGTSVGRNEELNLESHQNFTVNSISIRSCKFMTDSALKRFGVNCPNLATLHVKDCPLLTNDGLSKIIRVCSKITGSPWVRQIKKAVEVQQVGCKRKDTILLESDKSKRQMR